MGFGSYDESEQKDQDVDDAEGESVDKDGMTEDGDLSFESDASTDELVDQLAEIKEE